MAEKILSGVFSIYETDTGGYHIAYRADGEDEDKHIELPAAMVRMAKAAGEGKGRLGALFGMGG